MVCEVRNGKTVIGLLIMSRQKERHLRQKIWLRNDCNKPIDSTGVRRGRKFCGQLLVGTVRREILHDTGSLEEESRCGRMSNKHPYISQSSTDQYTDSANGYHQRFARQHHLKSTVEGFRKSSGPDYNDHSNLDQPCTAYQSRLQKSVGNGYLAEVQLPVI